MISAKIDTQELTKKIMNTIKYSDGFLTGAQLGQFKFNQELGIFIKEALKKYIDTKARINPNAFHHIYEWQQIGNSNARLFDFDIQVSPTLIKFRGWLLPSSSISQNSNVPFKDKAKIMEEGIGISIEPKNSDVLVFEEDGQTIFTKSEIYVENPGGAEVFGSFESVVNDFFNNYLTVGLLRSSGILDRLQKATEYTRNFNSGSKRGKSVGIRAGQKYMTIGGAEIQ